MRLALAAVAALASLAPPATARGDGGDAAALGEAHAALEAGDHARAAALAAPLARHDGRLARSDRAEAWRVLGLSLFFLGELDDAEAALLAYLTLEVDAHLDPALVPPEAIVFFEHVRARHGAELRTRAREPRRYLVLNFVPPAGQLQNGDRGTAALLAVGGGALLVANVGSFVLLRRWCDPSDGACETAGGRDRHETARTMRAVNRVSGIALIGVYAYGVFDGIRGQRRQERRWRERPASAMSVDVVPTGQGVVLSVGGRF